jgi:hypothetical protein
MLHDLDFVSVDKKQPHQQHFEAFHHPFVVVPS